MGRILTHFPRTICHFPKWFQLLVAALCLLAFASPAPSAAEETRIEALVFESGRMNFSVDTGRTIARYSINPLFVLPGEEVPVDVEGDGQFEISASAGTLSQAGPRTWHWRAPQAKGLHRLEVRRSGDAKPMRFSVFVMTPFAEAASGTLNGYRIGKYPTRLLPGYHHPRGFIEVTEGNATTLLSPHFQLQQFQCKQASGHPKYVVLQEKLLGKLELVLEKLNESGRYARTLHVMSGYRTPFYNHAIGNVRFSRHQFGDAADVFVDENGDAQMDDLNRDGRSDRRDAQMLSDLVEDLERSPVAASLLGGLSVYRRNAVHGPFVHVDARGTPARW